MNKLILLGLWMIILSIGVQAYSADFIIHNKSLISNSSSIAVTPDELIFLRHCLNDGTPFDRDSDGETGICIGASYVNETNGTNNAFIDDIRMFNRDSDPLRHSGIDGTEGADWTRYVFKDDDFKLPNGTFFKPNVYSPLINSSLNWHTWNDAVSPSGTYHTSMFMFNFTSDDWIACTNRTSTTEFYALCGSGRNITDTWNFFNSTNHSLLLVVENTEGSGTMGPDFMYTDFVVQGISINNDIFQCQDGPLDTVNQRIGLGFKFQEEINQTDVNTVDGEAFFQLRTASNDTLVNLSISSFQDVSSLTVCVQPANQTFIVNGTVEFEDSGFRLNDHYLRNATIPSATTLNFTNFLLRDADGTGTLITILDENKDPIVDVIGFVQRFDPGTNTFRTTSMIESDSDGKDFIYLQHDDAWYRFVFTKNLANLDITEIQRITETSLTFDIFPSPFSTELSTLQGVAFNLTYDDNLGRFQVIFLDPTGRVVQGCLQVSRDVALNRTFLFNQCVTTSFGTLSYVPRNITGTYYATFYWKLPASSPQPALTETISIVIGAVKDLFGVGGKEGAALLFMALTVIVPFSALIHVYVPFLLLPLLLIAASSQFFAIFDMSAVVGGALLISGIAIIIWIESRKK